MIKVFDIVTGIKDQIPVDFTIVLYYCFKRHTVTVIKELETK